jgi:ribokinase
VAAIVAVCGSAAVDSIGYGPSLPRPGETVQGTHMLTAPGGKGANEAVAAARMGANVRFCGARGDDEAGQLLARALRADGIELSGFALHPGVASGTALIMVDDAGENQILALPGANTLIAPPPPCGAGVWLCPGELPHAAMAGVLAAARADAALALVNPSPVNAVDAALLARFDIAIVNEGEWRALGAALPERVVVTRGARGCVLLPEGTELPAHPARLVDSTGAGDCFAGALAAGLAGADDLEAAARTALVAAALSVERQGCQPSYPARAEVDAALAAAP